MVQDRLNARKQEIEQSYQVRLAVSTLAAWDHLCVAAWGWGAQS
jgi:hypothetical protein